MNPTVQVERDANAIAIVGMACRLPGGAHTPDAFWDLLIQRTSTMQVVPASRFNIADYYVDPAVSGADRTNRMGTDKGHFLTEATCFDEGFFNMSPRQAINTDPQQRVLLETVVDALDDAGYRPADEGGETGWNRERIGMYAASAFVSYEHNMSTSIDAFFVPGVARGFISGRASHFFKWQGPAITYDAACAAGLVAVHAACQSLLMRETDAVVAGGTNIITSPEFFVGLNKGFFVSSTGGCRTFDETGDGYCRGEAVGVVVLKRLADALRDNDPIHALILSSAVNHSGLAPTLTAPHVPALAALFTQNCEKAGVRKEEVRAVEMHAPGTQAGDWAEVEAVRRAFGRAPIGVEQVGDEALYISSIKPNVGHAESSAGIASLIKATLMLRHRMATPHIGVKTRVNPRLGDLGASGMVIPIRATRLTPAGGAQRVIVSVNSFGAQGSNANALIAEYIPPAPSSSPSSASASSSASSAPAATTAAPANSASSTAHTRQPTDPRTHHIIALSAKPHTPLPLILSRFSAHLEANPTIELGSLSYTTTARRVGYPVRMAFSVSSLEELKTQLAGAGAAALDSTANATTGNKENAQNKEGGGKKRIGFLLGGNGAQFRGMGGQMYESSRVFRGAVDECRGALRAALHANADVPANAGSGEEKQDGEEVGMGESEEDDILLRAIRGTIDPLLHTFEAVLAATAGVIAIEYALGRVWAEEWGVRPDVVLGHSLGEYAGLVLAGVLSLRDVMTLVVAKCRAMFDAGLQPQDGTPHGMLALGCSTDIALSLARTAGVTGLEIACFNGPSQTVFAGPRPALEALLAHVRASPSPPPAKILPGSFAWHSSYVAPHAARVISSASSAGITPQPATTPMLLNLSGNVLEVGATVDAGYLGTQMQSAVRWDACVANPLCAGVDVWIELSPKAILIPLLRSSLPPFPSSPASRMFLPTLNGAVDAWKTVTSALARLYEAGVPVDWAGYHKEYPVRVVRLPTYPFARNEHYIPYVGRQAHQHPQAQAQAQEEQEGRERAMKEAMQEEREEKERKKRKVRVVFALGTLEVEEAGRRYG
ncbi:thiolase-like protein, partial [Mycena metata]